MSKVNHPDHYNQLGIECIEVVRHFNFNRGNAIKYIWRAGLKGDAVEDLEKAIWYLRDEIGRIKPSEKQIISIQGREKVTHSIRYNDGTTKLIEAEPENVLAATPPQQETSQQEESSPHTPEKQKEGLRNDSTLTDLGQISTAVMEALQKQTDWITGRDLAYTMNLKNSYQLRNRVQGELARFFKEGRVQRQKNSRQNVFEYKALEPHEIPEAAPVGRPADPESLSRKVFDLLKESGKALTSAEIAEELDESDSRTLSKILSQFYERDQLARHLPEGSKAFVYSYEPEPVAPTLSPNAQTVLDTLKEFNCLTFYKNICEAVDLPESEMPRALKELKVNGLITSPKPFYYQVVS